MQDTIEFTIDGVLDLHTFLPREINDLIDDYIEACLDKGIFDIRIIHGKGKGVLRNRVYALLDRHPQVASFGQAPLEAGGWGAIGVKIRIYMINFLLRASLRFLGEFTSSFRFFSFVTNIHGPWANTATLSAHKVIRNLDHAL